MPQLSFLEKCILSSAFLLLSINSYGQERAYRRFNTQQVRATTAKDFPEYIENLQVMENSIGDYASKGGDDGAVINVPVIFHILGADGAKLPDEAQVQAQLDILNKCFGSYEGGKNTGNEAIEKFAPMGTSAAIQFYIPDNFEGVKGINIVKTDRKTFGLSNEIQDPKAGGIEPVDSKRVINIWIGDLDSSNAGYAHFPGSPSQLDGIVIDPDYFGDEKGTAKTPYTQGKTLVHLMGTYLGLYDLWNDSDPCTDDKVWDTPPHSAPTQEIFDEKNSRIITMCHGYILVMYMNFMDNTDDQYLSLFTQGQKSRMRAILSEGGPRNGLVKR